MDRLTKMIVDKLLLEKLINNSEAEQYQYVLLNKLERYISITCIILISLFYSRILGTTIFLFVLFSLRKYTGGYHAETFIQCLITSIAIYVFFCTFIYPFFLLNQTLMYLMGVISVLTIVLIGTSNNPNMDWNLSEQKAAKRKARILSMVYGLVLCICFLYKIKLGYVSFIVYAIMVSTSLLILGKILYRR